MLSCGTVLDPRSLAPRRDEVVESCRRRGVAADVDAAIACQERVVELQTELGEAGRRRNEHQAAGKRKLPPDERESHNAEGRRLKEEVTALEARLALDRAALEELLEQIPNLVHPDVPIGGEEDFRELRRVGTPPEFDLKS